jgi:hypothetical protein
MKHCCNNKCNNTFDSLGLLCPECREKSITKWREKKDPMLSVQDRGISLVQYLLAMQEEKLLRKG